MVILSGAFVELASSVCEAPQIPMRAPRGLEVRDLARLLERPSSELLGSGQLAVLEAELREVRGGDDGPPWGALLSSRAQRQVRSGDGFLSKLLGLRSRRQKRLTSVSVTEVKSRQGAELRCDALVADFGVPPLLLGKLIGRERVLDQTDRVA